MALGDNSMNADGIFALGSQIGQQVDLLWSASMAMLVAEFYIICRFLESDEIKIGHWGCICLYGSIFCHIFSLLSGYLARGAVIVMIKTIAGNDAICGTTSALSSYEDAGDAALAQFIFLMTAILFFVFLFILNRREIGKVIGGK